MTAFYSSGYIFCWQSFSVDMPFASDGKPTWIIIAKRLNWLQTAMELFWNRLGMQSPRTPRPITWKNRHINTLQCVCEMRTVRLLHEYACVTWMGRDLVITRRVWLIDRSFRAILKRGSYRCWNVNSVSHENTIRIHHLEQTAENSNWSKTNKQQTMWFMPRVTGVRAIELVSKVRLFTRIMPHLPKTAFSCPAGIQPVRSHYFP